MTSGISREIAGLDDELDDAASRWRVALVCFSTQNTAIGLAYGSFGPLLASTEQHFHLTRSEAAVGMSFMTLGMSLSSPLVGQLMQRRSVRRLMIIGAVFSAIGYAGLALTPSYSLALVMYAVIGSGVCLLAILGPLALVARFFVRDRARALSVVNLPIILFLAPIVIAQLLPLFGRVAVLFGIALVLLAQIPILMLIADDPVNQRCSARIDEQDRKALDAPSAPASMLGSRAILTSPAFWLLSLAIGVMAGSGVAFVVHVVPFGVAQGMSLAKASGLLSVYGGAGIFGTLLFGWICDKAGSQLAVLISAICLTLLWAGLTGATGGSVFFLAAGIGLCGVPILTYHGAALSELFGTAQASRAMGFSYAVKLPFLLSFAPIVGVLFLRLGGYRPAFLAIALMMAMASLSLFVMIMRTRGRRQPAVSV